MKRYTSALLLAFCLVACEPCQIDENYMPCTQGGHMHAVDLGLSVKWACCNVGAHSPEDFGGYYAWGETEVKTYYEDPTYKWIDPATGDFIKYNGEDGKTVLDSQDDAAHVSGEGWRMPTKAEMQELMDKCTWEWTAVNGVKGYKVSGNGNSIFLPAAGSYNNISLMYQGTRGCYLSSTLFEENIKLSCCLGFYEKSYYPINDNRTKGHTVRPVME